MYTGINGFDGVKNAYTGTKPITCYSILATGRVYVIYGQADHTFTQKEFLSRWQTDDRSRAFYGHCVGETNKRKRDMQ